jgi:hypothetical protein
VGAPLVPTRSTQGAASGVMGGTGAPPGSPQR